MAAAAMTMGVLCEVGPVVVRSLRWDTGGPARAAARTADKDLVQAAIAGGDDPLTLLGGRAVSTASVWRDALKPLLFRADSCLLVYPSWWPATRISAVARIAGDLAGSVQVASRASMLARRFRNALVVEIAPQLVLISEATGAILGSESRSAAPDVVANAIAQRLSQAGARPVCVDAPDGVSGSAVLAGMIATRVRAAGVRVHKADRRDIAAGGPAESARSDASHARRDRRAVATAAATAVLAVGAAISIPIVGSRTDDAQSHVQSQVQLQGATTALVEGRVTAQIPAGWSVRRVSTGPGSARIEVAAPRSGGAVLHVTQSRVPDNDLAATAVALRAALGSQPAGVFADFNPADQREGRPAVTYREIRSAHEIRWTVIVDDGVRIGVGCQSAPARTDEVEAACADAVRTARRIE